MKRRYKLLIGFLITGLILIIIFFVTKDRKIYYLSLGDFLAKGQVSSNIVSDSYGDYVSYYLYDKDKLEFYTKKYSNSEYRSIDILNDVKNNKKIKVDGKEITLKNALIKADIVTVSVGANDLFYKLSSLENIEDKDINEFYSYVDEIILDIDTLLSELRKACKEQIMVIGFYNPFSNYSSNLTNTVEPIIEYANSKLENVTLKYKMTFVDIHDSFLANDKYLSDEFSIYPTKDGYYAISKAIIAHIDEKKLAK